MPIPIPVNTTPQAPATSFNAMQQPPQQQQQPSKAVTSILDNDLYKFTMQQAVRQHYPNTPCDYRFTNRSPTKARLPLKAIPWLKEKIQAMEHLKLSGSERKFLEEKCPFLKRDYLDWLQNQFRFVPREQVKIVAVANGDDGDDDKGEDYQHRPKAGVEIMISGEWEHVILYEVPVLALISEAYFRFGDQDWDYEGQVELAAEKSRRLVKVGAKFAEFGTRRRRDYETQRLVLLGLMQGSLEPLSDGKQHQGQEHKERGFLTGTSNLHFAHLMNLTPIGTMAHEWFMGTAALLKDAGQANKVALENWAKTYPGQVLGIALTDTFTTEAFLEAFQGDFAKSWIGVRHDSGDPFEFMDRIIRHYDQQPMVGPELRRTKKIVFSDGLNTDRAIRLQQVADEKGIQATFGIGTHFTNDYHHVRENKEQSVAMNIVIKLHSCRGEECVKLSDDAGKESGSPEAVARVRQQIAAAAAHSK